MTTIKVLCTASGANSNMPGVIVRNIQFQPLTNDEENLALFEAVGGMGLNITIANLKPAEQAKYQAGTVYELTLQPVAE